MSFSNEDVLKILEKRVGINGRKLQNEIDEISAELKKTNSISYNDRDIEYQINPEGESFILLKN